ncbi:dynamin family protein [Pseudomonas syringae pv. aptata]|uniref:dynamin family protein n=1 Tax=Pseudomonas syringae TaxID=317 RepID=UPI003F8A3CD6
MNPIEIIHNPFIVETRFLINGQPPAEGCKLSSYKESRLQVWVEKLFDELSQLFNGDNRFDVTFRGVESDYLDVVEASNVAVEKGMQVNMHFIEAEPAEERLTRIRQLMEEAKEHPQFEHFIRDNADVSHSFEEAFNKDFDVYVVATMSSGKSTLINAMLGRDLLPAANEATTATIARIVDNADMGERFSARRVTNEHRVAENTDDVSLEVLQEWNSLPDTMRIDIEGKIQAIQKRDSVCLVLTDTPGPNNSQDERHQIKTMSFIQDSQRNPLILYVLNASQLGTNDDKHLLGLVAETMRKGGKQSKDRFIFVINKMDVFDPEKGEDPPSVLARVNKYLVENGIFNPLIYPVSANLTRLLRKPQPHSRKERGELNAMMDMFSEDPSMNLLQYMPITDRVKRNLHEKKLPDIVLKSGLPAVEAMIDEYIDKYNFPHRVKRAYDAMIKAIEVGLNETHLIAQLDQDEKTLAHINEEIQALEYRQEKGFDTQAYKDRIAREGKALPRVTEDKLMALESDAAKYLRIASDRLTGTVEPSLAEVRVKAVEEELQFQYRKLINEYETLFDSSQKIIRDDLEAEYQRYILDLFKDCQHLNLPILDSIQKAASDISFNLTVKPQDIQTKEVVVDSYEVSDSSWYNPLSWWSKRTVYKYGEEKSVDLGNLWKGRAPLIETEFSRLLNAAREEINSGQTVLINQFLAFMGREFEIKFNELLDSLKEKMTDRTVREKALLEARELQSWISRFKAKLDDTLAV